MEALGRMLNNAPGRQGCCLHPVFHSRGEGPREKENEVPRHHSWEDIQVYINRTKTHIKQLWPWEYQDHRPWYQRHNPSANTVSLIACGHFTGFICSWANK